MIAANCSGVRTTGALLCRSLSYSFVALTLIPCQAHWAGLSLVGRAPLLPIRCKTFVWAPGPCCSGSQRPIEISNSANSANGFPLKLDSIVGLGKQEKEERARRLVRRSAGARDKGIAQEKRRESFSERKFHLLRWRRMQTTIADCCC